MIDIDKLNRYEAGEMNGQEIAEFIGGLVKSGLAWRLPGSYGRTAQYLINAGVISPKGDVVAIYSEDELE